jgi:hypothetical protein
MGDFKATYYSTRCFLAHHDPYSANQVLAMVSSEGGLGESFPALRWMISHFNYPPTALLVLSVFASLPFGYSHLLFMCISAGALILGGVLIWDIAAPYAPTLSGALIGFVLMNSFGPIATGNVIGICIGCSAVAVWCFLKKRFELGGVLCLALGLMLKPHVVGFVWLYFLLTSGYRKRALQTLGMVTVAGLVSVALVNRVSPHWVDELHTNLALYAAPGGVNDQGPTSARMNQPSYIIDLQTAISPFRDDPHFYNGVSYGVSGILLLAWSFLVFRTNPSMKKSLLALAAVAPLTMLPVYHRTDDAELLLLVVPACALLWSERKQLSWIVAAVTITGSLVTADIPWLILTAVLHHLPRPVGGLRGQVLVASQMLPVPLVMLMEGVIFLWIYSRHVRESADHALFRRRWLAERIPAARPSEQFVGMGES